MFTAPARHALIRSGSIEEIVAPTPRKPTVPASPDSKRREKRKSSQESLFGEAGQELQTIFFQCFGVPSQDEADCLTSSCSSFDDEGACSATEQQTLVDTQEDIQEDTPEDTAASKYARLRKSATELPTRQAQADAWVTDPSPPMRSSNPIVFNSPFNHEDAVITREPRILAVGFTPRPRIPQGKEFVKNPQFMKASKARAASWPALTKLITS